MQVLSTPSFNKDIEKLKDKKVAVRVENLINRLLLASAISEIPGIKKMEGADNVYRARIGDYRIGFFLSGNSVTFVALAHRKDIYKYFP